MKTKLILKYCFTIVILLYILSINIYFISFSIDNSIWLLPFALFLLITTMVLGIHVIKKHINKGDS